MRATATEPPAESWRWSGVEVAGASDRGQISSFETVRATSAGSPPPIQALTQSSTCWPARRPCEGEEGTLMNARARSPASSSAQDIETTAWHALAAQAVLEQLSAAAEGLSSAEARVRLERFGPNRLPPPARRGALRRFLAQFQNLLIHVLLGAAAVAVAPGRGGECSRHPRRGRHQRDRGLRPGGQGRGGAGGDPRHALAAGDGDPRR